MRSGRATCAERKPAGEMRTRPRGASPWGLERRRVSFSLSAELGSEVAKREKEVHFQAPASLELHCGQMFSGMLERGGAVRGSFSYQKFRKWVFAMS